MLELALVAALAMSGSPQYYRSTDFDNDAWTPTNLRPNTNYILQSEDFQNPVWMKNRKSKQQIYCQLVYLNKGMYAASVYGDHTTLIEVSTDWWPNQERPTEIFIPTMWRRLATTFDVPYSQLVGICFSSRTGKLWGAQVELEYTSDYIKTRFAPVTKI